MIVRGLRELIELGIGVFGLFVFGVLVFAVLMSR